MKIVSAVQWLSTAFVLILITQWVAVGHPGTTTNFLWKVQGWLAGAGMAISETDLDLTDVIEDQRERERRLAEEAESNSAQTTPRPLGLFPTNDGRWK